MRHVTLGVDFFDREPDIVARALIGATILRCLDDHQLVSGRIVETEAYLPMNDPAAHGARGRTRSNEALFMSAGTLYIHAMHRQVCMDIVTENSMKPGSVLIRAIEPLTGLELMHENRGTSERRGLTNGPGKICQALSITRDFDKQNVTDSGCLVRVAERDRYIQEDEIIEAARVGLSKATDLRLRFYLSGSPYLSRKA